MFDSGIIAQDLIKQVKDEADIAYLIPDESYIMWLNALEQLLYTELIQEQGKIEIDGISDSVLSIDDLTVPIGENAIRFEDIHAVYADNTQLIESTAASGVIFPDTYYKIHNDIGLNLKKQPEKLTIVYYVRPELKNSVNAGEKNVMVPVEFLDLVKAKLRGEAYKTANEDNLAAKWINDYNVLLETFKSWIAGKQPEFGI